ncbi:MAG TPA: M28 family peptidase [Actinomycetota bacterium]|nr:M28 family peptidase [Actinomycetota bacterium]
MRGIRTVLVLAATASLMTLGLPPGSAQQAEPVAPDLTKLPWAPQPDLVNLDNWQSLNAYNVNHFVATQLPNRQPNDQTSNDPLGEPNPQCKVLGDTRPGNCMFNHHNEYLAWFEDAYRGVFADFGVTFRSYEFTSPGSTTANFATNAGPAVNKLAIVPGADHPEDLVLIGSHFDGVDGSPFAAMDSTAGTGVMLRTAKMLADYWRATGTRPSKTYVFAAWDAEEAGGVGSKFYVGTKNNKSSQDGTLPKDPNVTLTSYINHDPCGGHYPALYRGLPLSKNPLVEKTGFIPMKVGLHAPAGTATETAAMKAFNDSIPVTINQLFNYIDDTLPLTTVPGEPQALPVFVSKQEAAAMGSEVLEQESVLKVTAKPHTLFTTDAEDFHRWIPTLNPYPDNIGPHQSPSGPQDLGWGVDGLWQYHTPLDSFEETVRLTSSDQTGLGYSKGLAMSWEFCSLMSAWVMMQPSQGGLQTADNSVVAYFETPRPNRNGGTHTFDASGSYQYLDTAARTLKRGDELTYTWDFGDGTTGTGRVVDHTFASARGHLVTLTVTDPVTLASDTMSLKIGTAAL